MSDAYKITAIPPTDGITDPQARAWADAFVNAWGVRNGTVGANTQERFITKKEFASLTGSALANIFAAGDALPALSSEDGNGPATKITNAQLVNTLAKSIEQSQLFIDLGTKIQVQTVTRTKGLFDAGITQERTIRISRDNILASAINRVWGYIGGSSALIEDATFAAVTPAAALATSWLQVQAAVTDPNTGLVSAAAIRSTYEAYVSAVDGKMNASYTVRAQIDTAGRTVVGGFGLMATSGAGTPEGPQISFGVRADTFFISSTAATGSITDQLANPETPFIVTTSPQSAVIDGIPVVIQPGVYIKTAFIIDGTITTAKITDATITSAKIASATIGSIHIAANGVTFPVAAVASGVALSSVEAVVATCTAITITADDLGTTGTCRINMKGHMQVSNGATSQSVFCRIYINGILHRQTLSGYQANFAGPIVIGSYIDVGVGSYTIAIRGVTGGAVANCDDGYIEAVAFKR